MYEDLIKEINDLMRAMYMNTGTPIPYTLREDNNSYSYVASDDFYRGYEDEPVSSHYVSISHRTQHRLSFRFFTNGCI